MRPQTFSVMYFLSVLRNSACLCQLCSVQLTPSLVRVSLALSVRRFPPTPPLSPIVRKPEDEAWKGALIDTPSDPHRLGRAALPIRSCEAVRSHLCQEQKANFIRSR